MSITSQRNLLMSIRRVTAYLSSLALGYKLVLLVIVSTISGHSYFGFIGQYATYNFAWNAGIRLPFENLPFYSLLISIIGFSVSMLIMAALFIAISIWYYSVYIMMFFVKDILLQGSQSNDVEEKRCVRDHLKDYRYSYLSELSWQDYRLAVMVAYFPTYLFVIMISFFLGAFLNVELVDIQDILYGWKGLIIHSVLIVFMVIIKYPKISGLAVVVVVGTLFSILSVSFFLEHNIANILREARFGGGDEITILQDCKNVESCNPVQTGCLVLRTERASTLYNLTEQMFSEIPAERIVGYEYVRNTNWCLPGEIK